MNILLIIGVVLVFGVLILVHELGHFVSARLFHVGVNEFSIGMGPAIFSRVSKKNGIKYSLRLFPIGGYVSMVGEDRLEAEDDASVALCKKPVWQRFIVLASGAAMNLVIGFVIMAVMVTGQERFSNTTIESFVFLDENNEIVTITEPVRNLEPGDKILKIGNERIRIYDDLLFQVQRVGADKTDVTVLRNGEKVVISNMSFPTITERGIVLGYAGFIKTQEIPKNVFTVIHQTVMQTYSMIRMIYETLFDTISGRYGMAAVSGPVGVVETVSDTVAQTPRGYKLISLMYLVTMLTINLGIMNLLPFPALDGGRIFFLVIELIRGKPVKPEYEGYVHLAGMIILLAFMAFVTYNDIIRIIQG